MNRRMLVAGIGNVFLGDDAFGVEVAQRLAATTVPEGVEVLDVGIRGVHLAYQLMDGYDTLVLVDAISRGEVPGTVTVLEPLVDGDATEPLDPHRLEPGPLLVSMRTLGALPPHVLLVGCEPADLDEGMGLSPVVHEALGPAITAVRRLIDEFVERGNPHHEEEIAPAGAPRSGRVRRLPPASRHRAVLADQADVSTVAAETGRS